jgi:hypothetical protein
MSMLHIWEHIGFLDTGAAEAVTGFGFLDISATKT